MHCDACVRRVKKALEGVPGVEVQNVAIGSADFMGDPALAKAAVEKAGFVVHQ